MGTRKRNAPRNVWPRLTIRELIIAVVVLAVINAVGAGLKHPLGTGPGLATAEGQAYFGDEASARKRAAVDRHRVQVLRVVSVLIGNVFVLTVLGYAVLARYLEELRDSRHEQPVSDQNILNRSKRRSMNIDSEANAS